MRNERGMYAYRSGEISNIDSGQTGFDRFTYSDSTQTASSNGVEQWMAIRNNSQVPQTLELINNVASPAANYSAVTYQDHDGSVRVDVKTAVGSGSDGTAIKLYLQAGETIYGTFTEVELKTDDTATQILCYRG